VAIKIFEAAEKKDFKAIDGLVKDLANPKPAADAKKIDFQKGLNEFLKGIDENKQLAQKDVMDNFKTTDKYGTNSEADIKANSKKATAKAADVNLIALRVLAMSELNKTITKAANAADKKEWDGYNEKMIKAATDLQAASKKKTSPADLAKLFTSLDSSCTACHDKFK
jgi:soluble cytochrome b562